MSLTPLNKGGVTTGFRTGAFCRVWSIEPGKGNFTKVRLSISRKNKDTDQYEQEFSGFVMMIGHAHAKAQRLNEGDRIKLGDVDVTTTYNKEQRREYVNYKCFDYEMAEGAAGSPSSPGAADANPVDGGDDVDEEPPF